MGCSIVAVVVAAAGAAILDVATIIIASVKIVGIAVLTQPLFLLLRWIIQMPSTKSMDKRLPPPKRIKGQSEKKLVEKLRSTNY